MNVVIIGSGPGGYVASIKSAQLGASVTVIEETEIGGTCLNCGCIPTKSLIASAEMLTNARKLDDFGIELNGKITPNISKIIQRKDKIVNTQINGIKRLFKSWGITLKKGRGKILSPKEIEITSNTKMKEVVKADKIIIATGSSPAQITSCPFDGKKIINSTDALKLTDIPNSILIVGAGILGCEFACFYNAFGSDVTIVEMLPRIIATEDIAISKLLERELKKKKIKIHTNTKIKSIELQKDGVRSSFNNGQEITTEKVLVAAGRKFNSQGLGLEEIGVHKGANGEIIVNDEMETNLPGIYAIGDVIGGFLLAHVASKEGITAAKNIMGAAVKIDYSGVPKVIFTSPKIASIGMNENQAAEKGLKVSIGYFQFKSLGKAHIMGGITGFIKIVSDGFSDKILGVHIIGTHASELIHEGALAIKKGLKTRDIAETIHAHPTLSEGIMEAAGDVHNEATHVLKK